MPYKDPIKQKEFKRRYYKEHRELLKARASDWNKKHPERYREIQEEYKKRNKKS
jgi:hypothetical protein